MSANLALSATATERERRLLKAMLIAGLSVVAAVGVGATIPHLNPTVTIAGVVALALIGTVAAYPQFAAYTLLAVTPFVAGIDRGAVVPVFRPSEVVAILVVGGLTLHGLTHARQHGFTLPRLRTTDLSILALAVTSSVIPLVWMLLRNARITGDDIFYALVLWKLFALYVIFRCSVRTAAQVKTCLFISMCAAGGVALIAIMQSLQVFGVNPFLQSHFAPYGVQSDILNRRGGATLSLPIAVADLMVFNLAIAFGLIIRGVSRGQAQLILVLSILFVAGVLSAGELSGIIGFAVACITLAAITRRGRYLVRMIPVLIATAWLLQPVLHQRLSEIDPHHGLPVSWVGRLDNLRTFFWPRIFSGFNWVLGIQPSARVASTKFATGWVWIESGYTWLLWGGGIPLLLAYVYFTYGNIRINIRAARFRRDAVGAAALAAVVGLIVVAVGMVFDPHLTYRGSADLLFALLALALVGTTATPRGSDGALVATSDERGGP